MQAARGFLHTVHPLFLFLLLPLPWVLPHGTAMWVWKGLQRNAWEMKVLGTSELGAKQALKKQGMVLLPSIPPALPSLHPVVLAGSIWSLPVPEENPQLLREAWVALMHNSMKPGGTELCGHQHPTSTC